MDSTLGERENPSKLAIAIKYLLLYWYSLFGSTRFEVVGIVASKLTRSVNYFDFDITNSNQSQILNSFPFRHGLNPLFD